MIHFGKILVNRLPDPPAIIREGLHIGEGEFVAVLPDEVKPIAAPRHITRHLADTGNINGEILLSTPARDVGDRNFSAGVQRRCDDPDRSFDLVLSGFEAVQVGESDHKANRAMTAHSEITDVVEEDHSADAGLVHRFDEQRADDRLRAAWLVDDGRPIAVELEPESLAAFRHWSGTKVRSARHGDTGWLAAGVRINDGDPLHGGMILAIQRWRVLLNLWVTSFQLNISLTLQLDMGGGRSALRPSSHISNHALSAFRARCEISLSRPTEPAGAGIFFWRGCGGSCMPLLTNLKTSYAHENKLPGTTSLSQPLLSFTRHRDRVRYGRPCGG